MACHYMKMVLTPLGTIDSGLFSISVVIGKLGIQSRNGVLLLEGRVMGILQEIAIDSSSAGKDLDPRSLTLYITARIM